MQDNIIILGNRDDVGKLLSITDIYLATSLREGLPVNIMEAMYKKLPIIAMNNRGHRALKSGIIIENEKMMKEKIIELIEDKNFRKQLGDEAFKTSKKYSIEKVIIEMENIYSSYI